MKGNHNTNGKGRLCTLVVINMSKIQNERKSQQVVWVVFGEVCCN